MTSNMNFLVLSIDYNVIINKFVQSYLDNKFDMRAVLIVQGFSEDQVEYIKSLSPNFVVISDDNMYNKGYSISEIRDYFISKYYDLLDDYVLIVDDDINYKHNSLRIIKGCLRSISKPNSDIGLINLVATYKNVSDIYISDANIPTVGTKSGILIRKSLLSSNYPTTDNYGSYYKILYAEEPYLATKIYCKGYRVCTCKICSYNKSFNGGLTAKVLDKYGTWYPADLRTGNNVLGELGLINTSIKSSKGGILTGLAYKLHNTNKLTRSSK